MVQQNTEQEMCMQREHVNFSDVFLVSIYIVFTFICVTHMSCEPKKLSFIMWNSRYGKQME